MYHNKRKSTLNFIVAVLILIAGVAIGGYSVLKSKTGTASIEEQLSQLFNGQKKETSSGLCQPRASDPESDSDQDGLKDWEEAAWNTDPCNPDSDGDLYFDGEEVASGYDPTKPAPEDAILGQEQKPRQLPSNLTQALGEILTEKVVNADGSLSVGSMDIFGGENSPFGDQTLQSSIEQMRPYFDQLFVPPQISPNELNIINETNEQTIENYTAGLVRVFDENPWLLDTDSEKTDAQIITEAIQANDFAETDRASQIYLARYKALKKIAVPAELLSIHQKILEKLFIISQIYQSIKEAPQDPLKVMVGLENYQEIVKKLEQLGQELNLIYETHKS